MLRNQPFCRADEVIEYDLLVRPYRLAVPGFAIFSAATNVGDRINATHLQPRNPRWIESRQQRDAIAAIAVQEDGVAAVQLQPLAIGKLHRNARTVFAGVKHLMFLKRGCIERHLGRAKHGDAAALRLITVYGKWRDEIGETIEGLAVARMPAKPARGARPGQDDLPLWCSIESIGAHLRMRIVDRSYNEFVIDESNAGFGEINGIAAFGNHRFPALAFRVFRIERNYAATRGVERRQNEHIACIGANVDVCGVKPDSDRLDA